MNLALLMCSLCIQVYYSNDFMIVITYSIENEQAQSQVSAGFLSIIMQQMMMPSRNLFHVIYSTHWIRDEDRMLN